MGTHLCLWLCLDCVCVCVCMCQAWEEFIKCFATVRYCEPTNIRPRCVCILRCLCVLTDTHINLSLIHHHLLRITETKMKDLQQEEKYKVRLLMSGKILKWCLSNWNSINPKFNSCNTWLGESRSALGIILILIIAVIVILATGAGGDHPASSGTSSGKSGGGKKGWFVTPWLEAPCWRRHGAIRCVCHYVSRSWPGLERYDLEKDMVWLCRKCS